MTEKIKLLQGIKQKLEGERVCVSNELEIFLDNLQTLPDHTHVVKTIEEYLDKITNINDKIQVLDFMVKSYDTN